MTVAYHGTPHWHQILEQGLLACKATGVCSHIWLARQAVDAAQFGVVLVVDMIGIKGDFEDGPEGWQGCYHGGDIAPDRIKLLEV